MLTAPQILMMQICVSTLMTTQTRLLCLRKRETTPRTNLRLQIRRRLWYRRPGQPTPRVGHRKHPTTTCNKSAPRDRKGAKQ